MGELSDETNAIVNCFNNSILPIILFCLNPISILTPASKPQLKIFISVINNKIRKEVVN